MSKHNQNNLRRKSRRFLCMLKQCVYFSITGAGIFFIITGVKYWIVHSDIFRVAQVEVNGVRILSEEDIRSTISFEPDQRIFDIDMEPFKKKIEANPYVAHVSLGREFPGIIKIDLQERIPVAFVALNKVYLVDNEGYLLPKIPGKNGIADFPIITGMPLKKPKIGARITDERMCKVLSFLKLLSTLLLEHTDNISEIHYNRDGSLSLFLSENGTRVEFGTEKYYSKILKLHYFLTYYEKQKQEGKLHYINLNYKDQIVVKEVG